MMKSAVCLFLLSTTLAGCINTYTRIDRLPDGTEATFPGLAAHLERSPTGRLHVLQTHGMGYNPHECFCAAEGRNMRLQNRVAKELGMVPVLQSIDPIDLIVGMTSVGKASTRVFLDPTDESRQLYFTCITWGEVGQTVKERMLELDARLDETNSNAAHQAPINRALKRIVNGSFSDPILYVGPLGSMIREAMWDGIQRAGAVHEDSRRLLSPAANAREPAALSVQAKSALFFESEPTVLLADSLGSRVIFDTLCEFGASCGDDGRDNARGLQASGESAAAAQAVARSIMGVYMFANQLPLLEIASIPVPPESVSLADYLPGDRCFLAYSGQMPKLGGRDRVAVSIVAFTDVNDPLSYHLSEEFRRRCSGTEGHLRFVNVTLPNARPRWLFVFSNPVKAHASGFKTNRRAIRYLVDGNS